MKETASVAGGSNTAHINRHLWRLAAAASARARAQLASTGNRDGAPNAHAERENERGNSFLSLNIFEKLLIYELWYNVTIGIPRISRNRNGVQLKRLCIIFNILYDYHRMEDGTKGIVLENKMNTRYAWCLVLGAVFMGCRFSFGIVISSLPFAHREP